MKELRLNSTTGPYLVLIGEGAETCLWIGAGGAGPVGFAKNTPVLRKFLRAALRRMEVGAMKQKTAIDFACSVRKCGAKAGEPCQGLGAGREFHAPRVNALLRYRATAPGKKARPGKER